MLWPIVLPFKIAFWCLFGMVATVTLLAPAIKWKRGKTFLISAAIAFVAFIPSCTGIMKVLDAKRFGVFEYESFADVDDFRVERYLPADAKRITLDKYAQGFRARYAISETELIGYLDDQWERYGEYSVVKRGEMSSISSVDRESHELRYGDLGWPHLENATEYYSPTGSNGAGFSVWYSRDSGMAYQRAGYW